MVNDPLDKRFRPLSREDVPLEKIFPDPDQPRKEFKKEDLLNLTENIRLNGILVPLVIMPFGPERVDEFLLIDGERRYKAAKQLGLNSVPCVKMAKVEGFNLDILRFAIHYQREDWTPFEKADKLYQMKETYGKSLSEISREIGISEQTIRQYLSIRELPQVVRDHARENKDKFKISYLTEMVSAVKSLEGKWRNEFPQPEEIISKKIDKDIIKSPIELRKLKEVFRKNNPVVIRRFFGDDEYGVDEAYIQSGRASEDFEEDLQDNVKNLLEGMSNAFKTGLYEHADRTLISDMKALCDTIEQFIKLYEEKQIEYLKTQEKAAKIREELGLNS